MWPSAMVCSFPGPPLPRGVRAAGTAALTRQLSPLRRCGQPRVTLSPVRAPHSGRLQKAPGNPEKETEAPRGAAGKRVCEGRQRHPLPRKHPRVAQHSTHMRSQLLGCRDTPGDLEKGELWRAMSFPSSSPRQGAEQTRCQMLLPRCARPRPPCCSELSRTCLQSSWQDKDLPECPQSCALSATWPQLPVLPRCSPQAWP